LIPKTIAVLKIYLSIVSFFFILLFFGCSNPIERKKEALKNCKVTLKEVSITKTKMLLKPPVPKVFFTIKVEVENTNDIPVTIERFSFDVFKEDKKEKLSLAKVHSSEEILIPKKDKVDIELDLQTEFEKNKDANPLYVLKEFLMVLLIQKEVELLFEGNIEFDTIFGKMSLPIQEKRMIPVKLF
jgi:hypothetical protein